MQTTKIEFKHYQGSEKLRSAVADLAGKILRLLQDAEAAPICGFGIRTFQVGNQSVELLTWEGHCLEITSDQYIGGNFDNWQAAPSLGVLMKFSKAIKNGLLEELKQELENRNAQQDEAARLIAKSTI